MKYVLIIKKWLGCILSFIVGICGLSFLPLPGLITDINAFNSVSRNFIKAHEILKVKEFPQKTPTFVVNSCIILFVCAIIAVIIYCLLIIWAIVQFFKNINLIKSKNKTINIINTILLISVLIISICLIFSTINFAKNYDILIKDSYSFFKATSKSSVGIYQYIIFILALIANIINAIFIFIKPKKIK